MTSYSPEAGTFEIGEASSFALTGIITGADGVAIPGGSLTSCRLWVYDSRTGVAVTGFDGMDIAGSVDGSGNLDHEVSKAALVVDATGAEALRTAVVRFTYGSIGQGWKRWRLRVLLDPTVT